jgi:hypothetical protein
MNKIYRVQDADGRGPYRPGPAHLWVNWDHEQQRNPTLFGDFSLRDPSRSWHSGFRTLDQLCAWFGVDERFNLEDLGYSVVTLLADQIILESNRELIFSRIQKLHLGIIQLPWRSTYVGEDVRVYDELITGGG